MAYKIIIREEAHADAMDAYNYYEGQLQGLGEKFLMALITSYDDLAEHPGNYGYIDEKQQKVLRDVSLERFPYVVIFEITGDSVVVYAVHNTHRLQRKKFRKK